MSDKSVSDLPEIGIKLVKRSSSTSKGGPMPLQPVNSDPKMAEQPVDENIKPSDIEDGPTPAKRTKVEDASGIVDAPAPSTSDEPERKRKLAKSNVKKEPVTIMDLNDDCSFELLDRMPLTDLCSMAEVCTHFKALAQRFFSLKHSTVALSSLANEKGGKYTLKQVRGLLQNFGNLIRVLIVDLTKLDNEEHVQKLLILIRRYCLATIDEMVFENHPNADKVGEFIATTYIGM